MKNKIKILILILSLVLITSCEKKEYKLIELTSGDLFQLLSEEKKSFIFATINERNKKEEAIEYKKALKEYAKNGKTNIYYLDTSDLIFFDDEMIYSMTNVDLALHYFYIVKNGKITANVAYEGKDILKKYLSGIHFDEIEMPIKESEKKDYLKKAKEQYEEGNICTSYQYLQKAWTLEAAKKFYRDNDYYKIINYWRNYVHLGNNKVISKEIVIFSMADNINTFNYSGTNSKYKYPKSSDYETKEFYIKDNYLYTRKNDKEKYKKAFEIMEVDDKHLLIKEDDKIYELYPFSYDGISEES